MESLPYRATVFLRPAGLDCEPFGGPFGCRIDGLGSMELMERMFATEADAVRWCRVMTEGRSEAAGIWMVARSKGGRMLELRREHGLMAAALEVALPAAAGINAVPALSAADETHEVLLGTALALKPNFVEPGTASLLTGELMAGA